MVVVLDCGIGAVNNGLAGAAAGCETLPPALPKLPRPRPKTICRKEPAEDTVEANAVVASTITPSSTSDRAGLFFSLMVLVSNRRQKESSG